jgi:hypothetical protein
MSENDEGFLAEPLDHVRIQVREKYGAWRELLSRVNRLAVKNQHQIIIHSDSNVERYAAVLFARTLSTTQASILLLEVGLVSQARVLLRSALETLFALAAIAKDPGVVDKLVEGHTVEQKRVARNMPLWLHPELKKIADTETASERFRSFVDSPATGLSAFDLAQKGGLEDWYRTVYMVFSWPVHGAAIDLNRHVVMGDDGDVKEFRNEPEIDGQESSWLCAIEVLLKAIDALATVFPDIDKNPMGQLYTDAHALADKISS